MIEEAGVGSLKEVLMRSVQENLSTRASSRRGKLKERGGGMRSKTHH